MLFSQFFPKFYGKICAISWLLFFTREKTPKNNLFIVKKIAVQKRTTFWSFCTGFFGIFFNLFWQCLYKGINFWLSNYIKIHDKVNFNEFVPSFPKIKSKTIIQYRIRTLFFKNIFIEYTIYLPLKVIKNGD